MINQIVIAGRLTRDCEVKHFDNSCVGRFTLAVDRPKYKDKDKETDFIDCQMWNCEKLAPYLVKGKPIAVTGSLEVRNWEDKEGNKRKAVEVKVDRVSFLPDGKGQDRPKSNDEPAEVPFEELDLPF